MKRIILILVFSLLVFSGCNEKVSGDWEINLNLEVINKKISDDNIRLQLLPVNVVLEEKENIIYILPPMYLKEGFTGKGYIKDNMCHFTIYSFETFLFLEQENIKVLDLFFQCNGEITPEYDAITGTLEGNLILITDKGEIPCEIEDGTFTMRKKRV